MGQLKAIHQIKDLVVFGDYKRPHIHKNWINIMQQSTSRMLDESKVARSYKVGHTYGNTSLATSLEVKDTISKLQPGATGPDGIHNLMLKNLPDSFVELLTELFNRSVIESVIPSEWNKAIVIPLLKAGKDPKLVDSYRPISLTSCVAKLIERVIKQRILTPLSDHIQIEQLGFLPGRSTTDALVRLEHLIKLSFKKRKAVHVIFLDMDSAFDRVDVGQLIRKLSVMGLPNLLVNWFHQFLMGREVQASLGGSYSEFKRKAYNIGLPQGSVLSPLLFSVYCHNISLENVLGAELFLYAVAVAVVGRDPLCLQSASQKAVDTLSIWANSNNMVFSTHKSVCCSTKCIAWLLSNHR
ncbi:hypothetical protein QYM36_015604 [Artemia franciscana]|uniref:Reverse transcriptase domain-containing protein n=1 Tax=Artemia franciscana TaxID=6661 RepID=A0AA88HI64_ARTSF|nr:hypothetical protein QYM36_015604 [Artemia franciscana]